MVHQIVEKNKTGEVEVEVRLGFDIKLSGQGRSH